MSDDDKEPVIVQKKAIDVVPYFHGIYCTVGGGKPFVNVIEMRRWAKEKDQIVFMLGTHNYDFRNPDELMDVVEMEPSRYQNVDHILAADAEFRKKRPISEAEYALSWAL